MPFGNQQISALLESATHDGGNEFIRTWTPLSAHSQVSSWEDFIWMLNWNDITFKLLCWSARERESKKFHWIEISRKVAENMKKNKSSREGGELQDCENCEIYISTLSPCFLSHNGEKGECLKFENDNDTLYTQWSSMCTWNTLLSGEKSVGKTTTNLNFFSHVRSEFERDSFFFCARVFDNRMKITSWKFIFIFIWDAFPLISLPPPCSFWHDDTIYFAFFFFLMKIFLYHGSARKQSRQRERLTHSRVRLKANNECCRIIHGCREWLSALYDE